MNYCCTYAYVPGHQTLPQKPRFPVQDILNCVNRPVGLLKQTSADAGLPRQERRSGPIHPIPLDSKWLCGARYPSSTQFPPLHPLLYRVQEPGLYQRTVPLGMADLHCPSGELRRPGMETILINNYPSPSDEGNPGTMASHYQKTIINSCLWPSIWPFQLS